MGIGYKIGAAFDHGGGGIVGKIGYGILMLAVLAFSLVAWPFYKVHQALQCNDHATPQNSGDYDLRRIK